MRSLRALLVAVLLLGLMAGCASLPRSGPVQRGVAPAHAPDVSVEIAAAPPKPGAEPRHIVEGFLQAMGSPEGGYAVAREYLTPEVRDGWRPDDGVSVYADGYGVSATNDEASLTAPLIGRVDPDGAYRQLGGGARLQHDFEVVRVDGEWRISAPPRGILVSQYLFGRFFEQMNTYWFDPDYQVVVPDPIHLPKGTRSTTPLMQALLRGPNDWIRPSVTSAIPAQAKLVVPAASVDSQGIVQISFNEAVQGLAEDQRSRLAAQLSWTLAQVPGVKALRLTANGAPFAVREQTAEGVVPVGAYGWLDPVPPGRTNELMAVTEQGLMRVRVDRSTQLVPFPGALGTTPGLGPLAVDAAAERVAVATQNGEKLLLGRVEDASVTPLLEGVHGLLRPQWVRAKQAELWTMYDAGDTQRAEIIQPGGPSLPITLPTEAKSRIVSFRVSPDGVRVAAIREVDGRRELDLGRIVRSDAGAAVEAWRPIPLDQIGKAELTQLADVSWVSPTQLVLLAADDAKKAVKPYLVDQEAADITEIGQPYNWGATELACAPQKSGVKAVLVGTGGAWRYEDDYSWPSLSPQIRHAAYS